VLEAEVEVHPGGAVLLHAEAMAVRQRLPARLKKVVLLGIDPSAMVKLINELESAGLAKRQRRPGDRRAWEVSITPKGRRTLERARRLVTQVEDEVLGGLTAADRRQLVTLLRRAVISSPPHLPWRTEEGD